MDSMEFLVNFKLSNDAKKGNRRRHTFKGQNEQMYFGNFQKCSSEFSTMFLSFLNSPACEGDALGSRKVEVEDYNFWYRAWIHLGRQKATQEKPGSGDFP